MVLEGGPGAGSSLDLGREEGGYFSGAAPGAAGGTLYRFRLDSQEALYPDPASRWQPEGPLGPSEVVDPARFRWSDGDWAGIDIEGQVLYEMHVGTFTAEGTWSAAAAQLPELAACGITAIEHMPVADFPGRFGWGYDGVNLFAPTRLYGSPEDFRSFVDAAHASGLAVILDVVYNHFGPEANFLPAFSGSYLTDRYSNEWGEAVNFDGPESAPVREFFITNARYWIEEFHLDGLRLDATQAMHDGSPRHIIAAIARAVHEAAGKRRAVVIAENEPQDVKLVKPASEGGCGVDALWNDDFHHSVQVAVSGRREAYYTDYLGSPQEFVSMAKRGYLYQGQYYLWQKKGRGTASSDLPPAALVLFIQNHDQVANSCCGERVHQQTSPALFRAVTVLWLLTPGTPMLFQGQEFAASAPFLYFAELSGEVSEKVRQGRKAFLSQFPSLADPGIAAHLPDPGSPATFERCKLDLSERSSHGQAYTLHRDLLRLRREDPVFRVRARGTVDGAVLGKEAFVLRFFGRDGDDRLLVVNFGKDLPLAPAPEPLLAPSEGREWRLVLSSEDLRYGGVGITAFDTGAVWTLPGRSALVFKAIAKGGGR